jgi:hypothetical protein
MTTLLPPTTATLAELEKAHRTAVLAAAHCRRQQHALDISQTNRENYEFMANNAARRATKISQRIDVLLSK